MLVSNDDLEFEIRSMKDGALVIATRTLGTLAELAQQLAWTGSSFRCSLFEDRITSSEAIIDISNISDRYTFKLEFRDRRIGLTEEELCWCSLFRGASMAEGFPIPDRENEPGLEMSLPLVAAIGGVRHAAEFEGGVVLKGFSLMFVPLRREEDRVSWHLISGGDCETRLSYEEVLRRCPDRLLVDKLSLEDLQSTRAIIGWYPNAMSILGSADANYENIDYSDVTNAGLSIKLTGGSLGFQQFGVGEANITLGPKDGKCHFQRDGTYSRIISAAEKTPVLLYDSSDKRSWLVPASDVMLHIAHHRNYVEQFEIKGRKLELPTTGNGQSVKQLLLQHMSIPLSDHECYTLKDMIGNIWSVLEFLRDYKVQADTRPGASLHGNLSEFLRGFEFKAVVEGRSPYREKKTSILKSCGGWPALVKDVDALVLFASGYGDIIQPLKDPSIEDTLCHSWHTVRKGKIIWQQV
ncbi:hypothetical protein AJ80_04424 [Polytolypa hystricis UAMH7299]|uniref:Uncharacterized protein n=1 Tax=Polytolypa hystricis (strain UAMH7299) TaxID=1447883 RepID=A0A2B7YAW3_POLH7|nr:hypothetical protein AJ80_04424 [Polytolypa hystricis UAMH7299]